MFRQMTMNKIRNERGNTMETKTLHIIQKLAKVGKVLSKIIAICCIVGAVGCLVGIISLSLGDFESLKIGGVTIHSIIEKSTEMSIGTVYASMAVGLILCTAEAVMAKMAQRYFQNEITAGTPFTIDGAKEMLRLGIYIIGISLGALIAADISYAIVNHYSLDVADMHLDVFNQVGIGIAFIITSLLCKLGAERNIVNELRK